MTTRKIMQKRSIFFAGVGVLVLILAMLLPGRCSKSPAATPTPTKTPVPPTWTPTATPAATDTPTPTPTATPAPTDTPSPTPTITPTPGYTVPKAGGVVSLFTGLAPADPGVLQRRPLAIKVANQRSVIPQTGLSKADVVVESRVEFLQTRYTAIFQSQDAPRVGSIRSARLIDVELPDIFDAVLCFSGAVEPVRQKLYHTSDLKDQILEAALNPGAFYRDPHIRVPDNLFAKTSTIWRYIDKRGWNAPPHPTGEWAFSETPPEGGAAASGAKFPYPTFPVRWAYDAASGKWLRWLNGQPHIDKGTGDQLSADNVVILGAMHVKTLILEHGTKRMGANCANCSIEIQLWGEGPLKILRDGKVYEGKWQRAGREKPFRFVDDAGNPLPLKPGNSWWQVVPLDMAVTITP